MARGELQVQVHIAVPKPKPGIRYSSKFLDELAGRWMRGEKLPKRVRASAISWRFGNGPWKGETDPQRMKRVRADFQHIPMRFTGV